MDKPTVTIVIPAYNAAHYIIETLSSITHQTFSNFECIVIDDGSTDNTAAVVDAYPDQRIRCISTSNSGGPARPRNLGIDIAKGKYVFIFDSDDLMMPEKIKTSVSLLESYPHADMLFTNFASIDQHGELIKSNYLSEYSTLWNLVRSSKSSGNFHLLQSEQLFRALLQVNFVGTSSVALRRSALTKSDRFCERLRNSDDRLFWVNFAREHNAIFCDDILHEYRCLPTGISNKSFLKRGPSKLRALKKIEKLAGNLPERKYIQKQISIDYANLAYAFKHAGRFKSQRSFALGSFRARANIWALKLLATGYWNQLKTVVKR